MGCYLPQGPIFARVGHPFITQHIDPSPHLCFLTDLWWRNGLSPSAQSHPLLFWCHLLCEEAFVFQYTVMTRLSPQPCPELREGRDYFSLIPGHWAPCAEQTLWENSGASVEGPAALDVGSLRCLSHPHTLYWQGLILVLLQPCEPLQFRHSCCNPGQETRCTD